MPGENMASGRNYRTGLIITGDASGGIRAIQATESQLTALNQTQRRGTETTAQYSSAITNMRGALDKGAKAMAGMAAAGVTAMAAIFQSTRGPIDELGKLSRRLNTASEDLAGLQLGAELNGASAETLNTALEKMQKRLGEAAQGTGQAKDALEQLGLSTSELLKLNAADQFKVIADQIKGLDTQAAKAAATADIFSNQGLKLINTLDQGSEELNRITEEAKGFGIALSAIDIAKVEAANDAITRAEAAFTGVKNQITVSLAPVVEELANRIASATKEAGGFKQEFVEAVQASATVAGWLADGLHTIKIGLVAGEVAVLAFTSAFSGSLKYQLDAVVALGNAIKDNLLAPFKSVLELASHFSDDAKSALDAINSFEFKPPQGLTDFFNAQVESLQRTREELSNLLLEDLPSSVLKSKLNQIFKSAEERAQAFAKDVETKVNSTATAASGFSVFDQLFASIGASLDVINENNEKFRDSWDGIKASIDPAYAKIKRIEDLTKSLNIARDLGLIVDQAEFDRLLELVNSQGDIGQKLGQGISGSITQGIESGDWKSVGSDIGGQIGSFIGGAIGAYFGRAQGAAIGASLGGTFEGVVQSAFDSNIRNLVEQRQASQGTGSILGDINAKSESIANAVDITADASEQLVGINTDMLDALRGLQSAIAGSAASAVRGVGRAGFELPERNSLSSFQSNPISRTGLAWSTFGFSEIFDLGGKSKQIDEGIRIVGGQLTDIVDEVLVQAFATFKVKKHAFDDYDVYEQFEDLTGRIESDFQSVFKGIVSSISSGAEALGILPDEVQRRLDEFVVETQTISLKNLSADEKIDEINAAFSKIWDDAAKSVIPYLDEIAFAGEGAGETLARVATNLSLVNAAANQTGFSANYAGGELLGKGGSLISQDLVDQVGGTSEFASAISSFVQDFTSEAHQFKILTESLTNALSNVGLELPDTRDGFAELLQAQTAASESGRENIATILRVQELADDYYTGLEKQNTEAEKLIDTTDLQIRLLQAQGKETEAVALVRKQELDAADETRRAIIEKIHAAEDEATQLAKQAADYEKFREFGEKAREAVEKTIESIAGIMESVADESALRGLDQYDAAIHRINKTTDERITKLTELGASEDRLTEVRKNGQDAIDEINAKRNDDALIKALAEQNRITDLQIRLLNAQGNEIEAVAKAREKELAAATESEKALLSQVYAAEDAATALEKLNEQLEKQKQLSDFIGGYADKLATINLSPFETALYNLDREIENAIEQVYEYGGSISDLTPILDYEAAQRQKIIDDENDRVNEITRRASEERQRIAEQELAEAKRTAEQMAQLRRNRDDAFDALVNPFSGDDIDQALSGIQDKFTSFLSSLDEYNSFGQYIDGDRLAFDVDPNLGFVESAALFRQQGTIDRLTAERDRIQADIDEYRIWGEEQEQKFRDRWGDWHNYTPYTDSARRQQNELNDRFYDGYIEEQGQDVYNQIINNDAFANSQLAQAWDAVQTQTADVFSNAISDIINPIQDELMRLDMTPLEQSIYDINQQADQWIERLTRLGANEEDLGWVRDWQTRKINDLTNATEEASDAIDTFADLLSTAFDALERAVRAEQDALREAFDRDVQSIRDHYEDLADSLSDKITNVSDVVSNLGSIIGDIDGAIRSLDADSKRYNLTIRQQAQAQLASTLAIARAGGSLQNVDISDALTNVSRPSARLFGSFADYLHDFNKTNVLLQDLHEETVGQLSIEELTLNTLKRQLDEAREASDREIRIRTQQHDSELARLDAIVNSAQHQINVLQGIDDSIQSVASALAAFNSTIKSQVTAPDKTTPRNYTPPPVATYTAPSSTAIVKDKFTGSKNTQTSTATYTVPGYASGGMHSGGIRLVGETGRELEVTGPARYYSNADTERMLSGAGNADEIRKLREDQRAMMRMLIKYSQKTAKILERFDYEGIKGRV